MKRQAAALWDVAVDGYGLRTVRQPLRRWAEDDETETTLAVPAYRQTQSYTCGFTAGLMVLHTFKPTANEERFFNICRCSPDSGLSTTGLIRALRTVGIGVSERDDLRFDDLAETIEDGYPIITTITTPNPDVDHWVVVYGYGVGPSRLFVAGNGFFHDGLFQWSAFRRRWSPKGFGLVCWGK